MLSSYKVVEITRQYIFIRDLDEGGKSITNDAENVVADIVPLFPGLRLFYRDSIGLVDEILIKDGQFAGFSPGNPFDLK